MALMAEDGIETRPVFHPMHTLPPYAQENRFPISTMLGRRGISLPTHVNLSDEDLQVVSERLLHHLSSMPAAS
jgi:perosamine synthetase